MYIYIYIACSGHVSHARARNWCTCIKNAARAPLHADTCTCDALQACRGRTRMRMRSWKDATAQNRCPGTKSLPGHQKSLPARKSFFIFNVFLQASRMSAAMQKENCWCSPIFSNASKFTHQKCCLGTIARVQMRCPGRSVCCGEQGERMRSWVDATDQNCCPGNKIAARAPKLLPGSKISFFFFQR
jgi:hypothetical protein